LQHGRHPNTHYHGPRHHHHHQRSATATAERYYTPFHTHARLEIAAAEDPPQPTATTKAADHKATRPAPLTRRCGGHGPEDTESPAAAQYVGSAAVASMGGPRVAGQM
jgi:hypothetical protein